MTVDKHKARAALQSDRRASNFIDFSDYERGELETIKYGVEGLLDTTFEILKLMIAKHIITEDEALQLLYNSGISWS